jgi:hypothetical protein
MLITYFAILFLPCLTINYFRIQGRSRRGEDIDDIVITLIVLALACASLAGIWYSAPGKTQIVQGRVLSKSSECSVFCLGYYRNFVLEKSNGDKTIIPNIADDDFLLFSEGEMISVTTKRDFTGLLNSDITVIEKSE